MAKPTHKADEAIEAAREIKVPLLIRRTCSPHQQVVWEAISFLLKAHPMRDEFGLREIAAEANLKSSSKVQQWIDQLAEKGLLRQERPPAPAPGERNNFPLIRAKYVIPWETILDASLDLAKSYVRNHVQGGSRLPKSNAPGRDERQLSLNLHDPNRDHEGDPNRDHEGDPNRDHETDPNRDHERSQSGSVSCTQLGSPWMDGSDGSSGWMDSTSPAKKKRPAAGRPPAIPPPPPAELYAAHPGWAIGGPLPSHPRDLWRNACPAPTAAHDDKLAALAGEHDASTDGHGWYFVGRAILAGTDAHAQITSPTYIRNTLIRWRAEDSYGSDKARPPAREHTHEQRPRPVGSRGRRATIPTAQPAPHLSAGLPADELSDEDLQRIEDEAGEQFRRYLAERQP